MRSFLSIALLTCTVVCVSAQSHPLADEYIKANGAISGDPYDGIPFFDTESSRGLDFQRLDSTNWYVWDTVSQLYNFTSHTAYHYSTNTLVTLHYNGDRELVGRDSTRYDDDDRVIEYFSSFWTGSSWFDFVRFTYQYDAQGNLFEFLYQENQGDGLKNLSRNVYVYNEQGLLEERLRQDWSSFLESWLNFIRETYSYDGDNLLVEVIGERWNNVFYENISRTTYTYGQQDELLITQVELWVNNDWELRSRIVQTVNASLQITEQEAQTYAAGMWLPQNKILISYDMAGNQHVITNQTYDGSNWVNDYRTLLVYNTENNRISEAYQEYAGSWISIDSQHYYYATILRVNEHATLQQLFLYPNPVDDVLHWERSESIEAEQLRIYDMAGKLLYATQLLDGQAHLEVPFLWPGLYTIYLRSKENAARSLFIKQ